MPAIKPGINTAPRGAAESLGAAVKIEPKAAGSGKVVIGYSSLEQLDGILARLR